MFLQELHGSNLESLHFIEIYGFIYTEWKWRESEIDFTDRIKFIPIFKRNSLLLGVKG